MLEVTTDGYLSPKLCSIPCVITGVQQQIEKEIALCYYLISGICFAMYAKIISIIGCYHS